MTVRAPGALLIWGLLSAGVAPLVVQQPPDRRAQQPSRNQPPDRVPERQPPLTPPPPLSEIPTPPGDAGHGRYLVERVVFCAECHSTRDDGGEILEEKWLMGGPMPVRGPSWQDGWAIRTPRIRGLPGYSDAEAIRLLTQGAIDAKGQQLRLPMPRFRMTPQDAADVVAFLKSLR